MQSGTEEFSRFIKILESGSVLSKAEIDDALTFLDGVDGVVSEGTFILGYEGLARCVGKKLSFDELKEFVENYSDVLAKDADARYFFAQSLIESSALQRVECGVLISLMPSNYQPFLLKRLT